MKIVLIQYPDGYYEIMTNMDGECEVVMVPSEFDVEDHDLRMDLARRSLPQRFKDTWDYGHLLGYGYFSLLTVDRAAMDSERRWNASIVKALENYLRQTRQQKQAATGPGGRKLLARKKDQP